MAKYLQLALWKARGLSQHTEELKTFISLHNLDVMLISETHFTEQSYPKLPNYKVCHAKHAAGTAQGGTAIIIKNCIKHHNANSCHDFHQATGVSAKNSFGFPTITALYLPPRLTVTKTISVALSPRATYTD
jgi:exonuclease III